MGKLTGKGKHTVKTGIMRRGEYKCRKWELHLKLRHQQLKTTLYIYRLLYQNLMRNANQEPTKDTHTHERGREQKRKGRKKTYKNKWKTIKKMEIGTYILIVNLNVNGLNAPTKEKDWLNGYKNKTHIYAVYKRPTSDLGTHTD